MGLCPWMTSMTAQRQLRACQAIGEFVKSDGLFFLNDAICSYHQAAIV